MPKSPGAALICVMILGLSAGHARAQEAASPAPEILAFEQFIRNSGPLCQSSPSADCVERGWRFADRDGDGGIALAELESIRSALLRWTEWRGDSLRSGERLGIATGIWLVDQVGLANLFQSYNENGDSALSQDELLADVRLDKRPLGALLLDPAAVDRAAIARRLGKFAPMLEALLKPQ